MESEASELLPSLNPWRGREAPLSIVLFLLPRKTYTGITITEKERWEVEKDR
jgi:hypothetical protein